MLEPEYNIGKFWQEVSSRRKYINADKSICNVGNLDPGSKRLERPTKLRRPHQPMDYLTPAVVYYNHVKLYDTWINSEGENRYYACPFCCMVKGVYHDLS